MDVNDLWPWFSTLSTTERARFALYACRQSLPVWDAIYVNDPRPHAALALVEALLDGTADLHAVQDAAAAMPDTTGTWLSASTRAGEAVRLLAASAPTFEGAEAAVEQVIASLDRDWRWRFGTPAQIGAHLRRTYLGLPTPEGPLPRFRLETEESTGGDLFEIEHRKKHWFIDRWTGQTLLYLADTTSGRLIAGAWGDFTGSTRDAALDGDVAVIGAVRIDLRTCETPWTNET